jgi:Na+/H+ antiporter NhaD/arsenite permease-like protein
MAMAIVVLVVAMVLVLVVLLVGIFQYVEGRAGREVRASPHGPNSHVVLE